MAAVIEMVPFKLYIMPCCKFQACWVNPRPPNYCPECGKFVYPKVKECAAVDSPAMLKVSNFKYTPVKV